MTDNFEKKVAVDGPVVNAGELGSSTFSPGQALPAGPLGLGQRWTVARKREVVLRLLRDEPVQLLSRQLGVEIFRLEQWREKAIGGIDASLKQRKGDPVQAELDSAMKRIGELTMQGGTAGGQDGDLRPFGAAEVAAMSAAKAPWGGSAPTAVTRAAGMALTKVLANEGAPHNVLVNALCTGFIESGQWVRRREQIAPDTPMETFLADMAEERAIPLGRMG